ncbi:hypothetical protein [Brevibacillus daliensis]|uniref:hypothetical protein n=1 Tax=Brevibacillus daliensis TaxID=2892995 RepID=UPI001E5269A3|nr:hypothetical protein [Brevibacillus daliensis]
MLVFLSLLACLIVFIVIYKVLEYKKWDIIYEGLIDKGFARYSYLQSQSITCKIKYTSNNSISSLGTNRNAETIVAIYVYVTDFQKAIKLLGNYRDM